MPATSACVPSPPATPSRSAPVLTAARVSAATSTWPGPSMSATSAPNAAAFVCRSSLVTLPPPDRGFMIIHGRRGGGVDRSGMPVRAARLLRAARPDATDAAARTRTTTMSATRSRYRKIATTVTGAPRASSAASQRITPRLLRNHHRPARATARPTTPTTRIPMLWAPPTSSATTAANANRKASRASQRCATPTRSDPSTSVIVHSCPVRVARRGGWQIPRRSPRGTRRPRRRPSGRSAWGRSTG